MKTKAICLCCSHSMLYHLDRERDYWFCPSCRQKMPQLDTLPHSYCIRSEQTVNLSSRINLSIQPALV